MLKVASIFSQILGQVSRIDFLQTGRKTWRLSAMQKAFVPGRNLSPCFFAVSRGSNLYARYATASHVATESSCILA